jgi:cytochrome c oxidase cbb3-type subunit III
MKPSVPEYQSTPSIKLWFSIGILVFLSALSSFQYSNRYSEDTQQDILITRDTLLSLYGAYVFNSESCLQCHVLEDAISLDALSLDGLGGKYTDIWHLWHLMDPRSIQPESGMPAFSSLLKIEMDEDIFHKLMLERYPNAEEHELEHYWASLKSSSEAMRLRLMDFEPAYDLPEYSEMYALIAYLQSIPTSPRKHKLDSIVTEQLLKHEARWDSIAENNYVEVVALLGQLRADDISEGRLLFRDNCATCHREDGGGLIGPNLTDAYWLHGGKPADIVRSIVLGHPKRGMRSWKLVFSQEQVAQLTAFIQSLKGAKVANGKAPQGELQR